MIFTWILAGAVSLPHVDLYTMGPGQRLFERFGHAALCVVWDDRPQASRCYNYGTTDFGSPPTELGWQFVRGTARFWVSEWPLRDMVTAYVRADRELYRQRLPLSPEQVDRIQAKLASDVREENKYYVYHHFVDNCSTRLRDLIDQNTGGHWLLSAQHGPPTYRALARGILTQETGLLLVSDLALGRGADQPLTEYQRMFLPAILRNAVERRFGAHAEVVYRRRGPALPEPPNAVAGQGGRGIWVLMALVLSGLSGLAGHMRRGRWAVRAAPTTLMGLVGLILWVLAAVSTVSEFRWNEAVLVFVPADILVPLLNPGRAATYARIRILGLLVVSALLATGVLLQPLGAALLVPLAVFATIARPRGFGRRR